MPQIYVYKYVYSGSQKLVYIGQEPIYQIVIKQKQGDYISWQRPDNKFINENFTTKKEENTLTLTAKNEKGVQQERWHIHHQTAYQQNARSYIQFFSKKNQLQASKSRLKDNQYRIKRIEQLVMQIGLVLNNKPSTKKVEEIN